jgi:hypothetical protein
MWHIDPLIGNDRETKNETKAIARQRPQFNDGSTVGSSVIYSSVPRLYHSTDRVEVVSAVKCSAMELVPWSEASWLVT